MGIKNTLFGKKREAQPVEIPTVMKPENPVNYDSVLDYLVGLSKEDYDKMIKVTGVYREANRKAAGILHVEDQPTSTLVADRQTDEEIESDLDKLLETNPEDLKLAIVNEQPQEELRKAQAPSKENKLTVNHE